MKKVIWSPVKYNDITPDKYEVGDNGVIRVILTKKEIRPAKIVNEKGYSRVTLSTVDKKYKKYSVHRIVMDTFIGPSTLEVNHKNFIRNDNRLENLEYTTHLENIRHSRKHNRMPELENHFNSSLSNSTVHKICEMFESGFSANEILRKLDIPLTLENIGKLSKIKHRKTWTKISSQYNFDDKKILYKTYPYDVLYKMCSLLVDTDIPMTEIVKKYFNEFDYSKILNVLKKISQGKLYKKIMSEVVSSTTRERYTS